MCSSSPCYVHVPPRESETDEKAALETRRESQAELIFVPCVCPVMNSCGSPDLQSWTSTNAFHTVDAMLPLPEAELGKRRLAVFLFWEGDLECLGNHLSVAQWLFPVTRQVDSARCEGKLSSQGWGCEGRMRVVQARPCGCVVSRKSRGQESRNDLVAHSMNDGVLLFISGPRCERTVCM